MVPIIIQASVVLAETVEVVVQIEWGSCLVWRGHRVASCRKFIVSNPGSRLPICKRPVVVVKILRRGVVHQSEDEYDRQKRPAYPGQGQDGGQYGALLSAEEGPRKVC